MALLSLVVRAEHDQDAGLSNFRFSGYGTLSWHSDNHSLLAPIRDISQKPKESFDTSPGSLLDSRLAGHFTYRMAPDVEWVSQVVLRDQVEHKVGNAIELAYAQWSSAEGLKLRGGRVGYDAFLMSDHRNLGYATTAVRPPTEFYGWIPIFSVDGADISQSVRGEVADWKIRLQGGRSRVALPMNDDVFRFATDDLWSLSLTRESGPLKVKAALSEFRIGSEASPLAPLREGLAQVAEGTAGPLPAISAEAKDLLQNVRFEGTKYRYVTIGANYDDGRWLVQSELGASSSSVDIAPSSRMGYVLLGYRWQHFLPYGMLSKSHSKHGARQVANSWDVIGQGGFQQIAYGAINSTRVDQQSASLGVRWDIVDNMALKMQWDRSQIHAGGYALWFRSPEMNARDSSVSLVTLSLDFIF